MVSSMYTYIFIFEELYTPVSRMLKRSVHIREREQSYQQVANLACQFQDFQSLCTSKAGKVEEG